MGFEGFQARSNIHYYTSIPNEFFDDVLPQIETVAELKVILAIFRKTYGWVERSENGAPVFKLEDDISYSQFQALTGISNSSVSDGIKRAIEHGFIDCTKSGGLNSGSSTYRLRQRGDKANELCENKIPTVGDDHEPSSGISYTEEQQYIPETLLRAEVGSNPSALSYENSFKSTNENSSTRNDKADAIAELMGSSKEPEPEPKKRKKRTNYTEKPIETWNCNDLLAYFAARYRTHLGIGYPMLTAKERSQASSLIQSGELKLLDVVKAIDYYLLHYRDIPGLPAGFPSWAVFYGWRNHIIPHALLGASRASTGKKNMEIREYRDQDNTQQDISFDKISNSWGDE